jgi:hypothetical protein
MNNEPTSGDCWVAYFDILGFRNMLRQHRRDLDTFVKVYYGEVLAELTRVGKYWPGDVSIAWFSDSFLLFSHDESAQSFGCIEQEAAHFFARAIQGGMPLRGALGFGELYCDPRRSVYLGDGLIDAYLYAEGQDWIGFVHTPDATLRVSELYGSLPLCNYVRHEVPFKVKPGDACRTKRHENLYAYKPTDPLMVRQLVGRVMEMETSAARESAQVFEEKLKHKYEDTISFWNAQQ